MPADDGDDVDVFGRVVPTDGEVEAQKKGADNPAAADCCCGSSAAEVTAAAAAALIRLLAMRCEM
jgi:hypothetical protein